MSYDVKVTHKAEKLRKQGKSIKEIATELDISVGTSSIWLRGVVMDDKALARIEERKNVASLLTSQRWAEKRKLLDLDAASYALRVFENVEVSAELQQVFSSIFFWTEGNKTVNHVGFTNSDPMMVRVYLKCLRSGFNLDERKFRCLLHIHQYHDERKVMKFWSGIANIPITQFSKSYRKSNTGKRKKKGYGGSMRIRYYDAKIARKLGGIYNSLGYHIGA